MTSRTPLPLPSRLSARLHRDTPLKIVRAPHGFGKAHLAAQWARSASDAGRRVVRPAAPFVGFDDLLDTLAQTATPVSLVLERVDLIAGHRIAQQLQDLVEICPHIDVLVTAIGRAGLGPVPLDPTHDILTGDDLLLRRDDLREMFRPLGVTDDAIDTIHHCTGGMLELVEVAHAVPATPDASFADRVADAVDHWVRQYLLADPVVHAHRDFLVDVATAHTLDIGIARVLGGGTDSGERLDALERAGIVDARSVASGTIWQVPAATRRVLRTLQSGPDARTRSNRLALHFRQAHAYPAALRCAADAENWTLTIELFRNQWSTLADAGLDLMRDVLAVLPPQVLGEHPRLAECRQLLLLLDGDLPRDRGALGRPASTDTALREAADDVALATYRMMRLRIAGRYDEAAERTGRIMAAARAATDIDTFDDRLPFLRMQWALSLQLAGNLAESTGELRRTYRLAVLRNVGYIARNAAGNAALNWALAGETQQVREWLDLEVRYPAVDDDVEKFIRIGGMVARALTALDQLDTTGSAAALADLDDLPAIAELWPYLVYARSRHAIAVGDAAAALGTLADSPELRAHIHGRFVESLLAAIEIEAHLAAGNGGHARNLAAGIVQDDPWSVVAIARTHLISGDHHAAVTTCRRFDWLASPYTRFHLEALLVESAALHALDRHDDAQRTWRHACELADRSGLLSVYATIPRDVVAALATRTGPHRTVAAYLDSDAPEHFPTALARPDLTDREAQVLAGLVRGRTAPQIAAEHYLSLATIKSHRRTLFRKLGARSRTDAIARARDHGLLS